MTNMISASVAKPSTTVKVLGGGPPKKSKKIFDCSEFGFILANIEEMERHNFNCHFNVDNNKVSNKVYKEPLEVKETQKKME